MPVERIVGTTIVPLIAITIILIAVSPQLPEMSTGNVLGGKIEPEKTTDTTRMIITPRGQRAGTLARQIPGIEIRHEFGNTFSADVPKNQILKLKTLAETEETPKLELQQDIGQAFSSMTGTCGDKICSGDEITNCPQDCGAFIVRICTPTSQREYNIDQVNAGKAGLGSGIEVAVIDTGARREHLDLKRRIKMCVDTTGIGVSNGCEDQDSVHHGTHTAGIIAADSGTDGLGQYGAAPGSTLYIIKACQNGYCYADDVAEAIEYSAINHAKIISMSFGSSRPIPLIAESIKRHPEILFVASAGNGGPSQGTVTFPATLQSVLSIGAVDSEKTITWFSSRGQDITPNKDWTEQKVDYVAGGKDIEATDWNGCYSRLSGTSFSAPTIAGLAAAVWDESDGQIDGRGNPESAKEYLMESSKQIERTNDYITGSSGYGVPAIIN